MPPITGLLYVGLSVRDVRSSGWYTKLLSLETVRESIHSDGHLGEVLLRDQNTGFLRSGSLSPEAVDWLKTNFFKTELELGHCLRLPQEGPCECDLYLNCAKFVTTREYAPRLRARRDREMELIGDAEVHNWASEVERHRNTVERIERLLTELDEPIVEVRMA